MSLQQSANKYILNGLSIIPTDGTKKSLFPWKQFQSRFMTPEEIETNFSHPKVKGIAVICGKVSGNLEVIDVDTKYGIRFEDFQTEIKKASQSLYTKLYIIKTKNGGFHLYYRCDKIEGNQKLANRHATEEELKINPNIKELVLIETRGEGGYVVAPPTDGYEVIFGKGLHKLTIEERDVLLNTARMFNEVYEEAKLPNQRESINYGKTPWDDYNDRCNFDELMIRNGWKLVERKGERTYFRRPGADSYTSANYHNGKKVFYCFTTSSQFENKGYSPFAVFTILEHNGDFSAAARKLLDQGFGEKKDTVDFKISNMVTSLIKTGYEPEHIAEQLMITKGMSRALANDTYSKIKKDIDESRLWFWDIEYTQKSIKIKINKVKLESFLHQHGFGLYFHNPNSLMYMVVHVPNDEGYITEVSTEQIKKFIKSEVMTLPDIFDKEPGGDRYIAKHMLLDILYQQSDFIFNSGFYEFLSHKKPEILKDTADQAYFPFRNGVVVIDKNQVQIKNYSEINKKIWKSQINFNIDIKIDQDFDPETCEYYKFLQLICGKNDEKVWYALTLIGYILHSYKDPAKPYAPILAEETDDESKGGGTGKGIFIKALSYLIPTVRIDGKTFRVDKNFAFQRITLGDKLVVIEDCAKNVDFEKYYPTITEGMTIERKNKGELFLNYNESPKIAFTTNYSVSTTAEHAKRRQMIFEFTNYFSSSHTPMDEFGHIMFDNWEPEEWNRFYNLMFFCVSLYLDKGVLKVSNSEQMKKKHIKLSFGDDFLDYFNNNIFCQFNVSKSISDEWKGFLTLNELDRKEYSLKRFKKALDEACKLFNYLLIYENNRQLGNVKHFRIIQQ